MGGSAIVSKVLAWTGVYDRLKASWVYDAYWRIANPGVLADRDREVAFYGSLLGPSAKGRVIYDVGANQGFKVDIFLRLGARVVAIDPDPTNEEILKKRFLRYRAKRKPVDVIRKAVGRDAGVMTLWIDEPGSAKNTLSRKWVDTLRDDSDRFGHTLQFTDRKQVEVTTISDLIKLFAEPIYIKIDVEGHELDVIKGMREPVPYLSFEVNLPEFLEEGLEGVAVLAGLSNKAEFNYSATVVSGLALDQWLPPSAFSDMLRKCEDKSIEIFCRTLREGS